MVLIGWVYQRQMIYRVKQTMLGDLCASCMLVLFAWLLLLQTVCYVSCACSLQALISLSDSLRAKIPIAYAFHEFRPSW